MRYDMEPATKKKPIREVACGQCHMYTPAWRERCIHCNRPLANAPLRPPLTGIRSRAQPQVSRVPTTQDRTKVTVPERRRTALPKGERREMFISGSCV